jgi:hypothetical protein
MESVSYVRNVLFRRHNLYSSSNIMMVKVKGIRCLENVTRTQNMKNAYNILIGKPRQKRVTGKPRPRHGGRIKLNVSQRHRLCTGLSWLTIWYPLVYICEHGNKPSN